MAGSSDNLPIDDISLQQIERAREEFGLDEKCVEALKLIKANLPITGLKSILSEDYWLREILKEIESGNGFNRMRALTMLGQYLGLLSQKQKSTAKNVEFES